MAPLREEISALQARVARLEATARVTDAPSREAQAQSEARSFFDEATRLASEGLVAEALTLLRELQAAYPDSTYAARATTLYRELALIGSAAPPLAPKAWLQGDAAWGSAPLTVVIFFEPWCPHCPNQLQAAQRTLIDWRERGAQWVGLTTLSRDATPDSCRAWLAELGVTFPVAQVDDATTRAWAVTGVPAAAIVRDGVIVWRGHPEGIEDALLARWAP